MNHTRYSDQYDLLRVYFGHLEVEETNKLGVLKLYPYIGLVTSCSTPQTKSYDPIRRPTKPLLPESRYHNIWCSQLSAACSALDIKWGGNDYS